ncbi:MAG: hypothetical protein ABI224_18505 [Acetobacteraceae bacterium]
MPDAPVDPTTPRSYPSDMESRVAVLEQIARGTSATLERMERRMDRLDTRVDVMGTELHDAINRLSVEHRADFRWLTGIMLAGFGTMIGLFGGLLGVMAHGFHWL